MIRLATLLSAGLAVSLMSAPMTSAQSTYPQATQASIAPAFTDPQNVPADLARLDNALNSTGSFQGRFTQYGADGSVARGNIYLKRPGKLRFEYDLPSPLLIVSDGVTLAQQDRALETMDRVPLASTPLNFFLKENVQLQRDTEVVGLTKDANEVRMTARDGSGNIDGDITMVFDANNLALKAWVIEDSFGGTTRVVLSDLKYNQRVDPRLFVLRDDSRRGR